MNIPEQVRRAVEGGTLVTYPIGGKVETWFHPTVGRGDMVLVNATPATVLAEVANAHYLNSRFNTEAERSWDSQPPEQQEDKVKSILERVNELPDGTYQLYGTDLEIEDYAARWADGYIVGIRAINFNDLYSGFLFGVWTDETGQKCFDKVIHVGAFQDAKDTARAYDQKAFYDLRDRKVVFL